MKRNIYLDNLPLDQAQDKWYSQLDLEPKIEKIDIREALGRRLAEKVVANISSPHYPASAMDGIAVKAELTAGASEKNPIKLTKEEDYQLIDTGDPVAEQFDAVIMIENVNILEDGSAQIEKPAAPGQHIRKVGESLIAGEVILTAGEEITPYAIGLTLEGNVKQVTVYAEPKVEIIPTGTELVEDKEELKAGDIIEFNSHVLGGLAKEWGANPIREGIVVDDYQQIKKRVKEAVAERDFVVIIAGSSAGREDYTAQVIDELGKVLVHGVSIRPGGPTILGVIDDTPVMGVPGYPVAAALTFRLFARSVIYRLAGVKVPPSKKKKAKLSKKLVSSLGYREFVRVKLAELDGGLVASPLARSAGVLGSVVEADGLLAISEYSEGLDSGEEVEVDLLKEASGADCLLVTGSDDLSLDLLKNRLQMTGVTLTAQHVGSRGGLTALRRGEVHLAGVHLPVGADYSEVEKFLGKREFVAVNLASREVEVGGASKRKELNLLAADDLLTSSEEGLTEVRYDLIIPQEYLSDERVEKLLEQLDEEGLKEEINNLDGYQMGQGIFS
ncbi:molybdopterin-binding protein [Natroniella sulfidigena]|uniref:molybdenum cofactor synthesis domain-containing protein n=1 Tax=Natroniella sulfidigena TaxID=723921 RepID=UPI00200A19DA|nr:molybdenum cofactor synthesis domain-containing protein [Natroniella sulfidigena]MCK8816088.1 molybdopterin-binding protein [Natroniella sulfidigena]